MRAFLAQLHLTLRLHVRNTMALIYGYVFPTIFLIAFWVLYRYDKVPLVRHLGELLTVTILGGACFGLPTSLVSERERGVWRRYRLTPVATSSLVISTMTARYLLLLVAGALQVALAMGLGMPLPGHPLQLWLAFTCVALSFLGLGLVIATLADNVPAVQALGQCLFLPMLIIGGVAVPLASLPDWAQRLSSYFPGRYAVDALQACVVGTGLAAAQFSVIALIVIGVSAAVAGAMMFRWDAQQRFIARGGKAWLGVALSAWLGVGLAAEWRPATPAARVATPAAATTLTSNASTGVPSATPTAAERPAASSGGLPSTGSGQATPAPPSEAPPSVASSSGASSSGGLPSTGSGQATPAPPSTTPPPDPAPVPRDEGPATWQEVTVKKIDDDIDFRRLPPDSGVVTPIATADMVPESEVVGPLETLRLALPEWKPGKVDDPVQRVRNLLYVAAVPDLFQTPTEAFVPWIVFDRIQQVVPKDDLIKILYWIGVHPSSGTDSAIDEMQPLGFSNGPNDIEELRNRTAIYAVKLLGRILGRR